MDDTESVNNDLCSGAGQVSFYVENNSQHLTYYLFTVECGNLIEFIAEDKYQMGHNLPHIPIPQESEMLFSGLKIPIKTA